MVERVNRLSLWWALILVLVLACYSGLSASWAATMTLVGQPSQFDSRTSKVETFTPWQLKLDGTNRSRENDQLILYTPNYGEATHTNAFGVEVWARRVPSPKSNQAGRQLYQVQGMTNIFDCDKSGQRSGCGNAAIPPDGVVISASGNRRQAVLDTFRPGSRFEVQTAFFQKSQMTLDMVDPTDRTNPKGRTYPGLRGSGQLIAYTSAYGQPTTGTNEYGFEVTVVGNRVTEANGANSPIPPGGYVLSGHGKMRDWLIQYAPVGARIDWQRPMALLTAPDPQPGQSAYGTVVASVDYQSYRDPFAQTLTQIEMQTPGSPATQPLRTLLAQADQLAGSSKPDLAVAKLQSAQPQLNTLLWKTYPQFPKEAVRAVWHRPVEMTQQSVAQTLDRFQRAGLNAVFLETLFHGYPLFASDTYREYGITANQYPSFAGKDVLGWWTTEAHKRGMKVHAWFQTFYAGNKAVEGIGPVLSQYPQWANIQRSSANANSQSGARVTPQPSTLELGHYFLDPANPEVQTFLLAVLQELVSKYPVDGVQLDYIRYPNSFPRERIRFLDTTWGYTAIARRGFQNQTGVDPIDLTADDPVWPQWGDYKAQQVTNFVQKANEIVTRAEQSQNRTIALSADIFPDAQMALMLKHQDWSRWLGNGWLDFVAPMSLTGAVTAVQENVTRVVQSQPVTSNPQVVSGVFGPFNNLPAQRLMEQLDASLKGGASGYAIFDSAHLTGDMMKALSTWQVRQAALVNQTTTRSSSSASASSAGVQLPGVQKSHTNASSVRKPSRLPSF